MRRTRTLVLAAMLSCLAVVALVLAGPMRAGSARAEPLRMLVEGAFAAHHTPLFLAMERGHFAEQGVEPVIEPGLGSNMVAVLVGQRAFDMGQLSASIAAISIDRGVPIRMIAIQQPRSPIAIVGIRERVRLAGPQSLEGLRLGMTPGGTDGVVLSLLRRANSLSLNAMVVMPLDQGTKLQDLVSGRLDVVLADALAMASRLRAAGHEAEVMELADHGVPLQGLGFVAGNAFLSDSPDLARRALAAIRRGMADAAADPAAACRTSRAKEVLVEDEAECVATLTAFLAHAMPATASGWGRQSREAWAKMIGAMRAAGEIHGTRPSSAYYTNSVVP